jgi:8-oxo-dGTP pyrophosphatase MutT (NUDIX family)
MKKRTFNLPRGSILPVETVKLRLDPAPLVFEVANSEAIARNWEQERAANPHLFDGSTVLFSTLALRDGALMGIYHRVSYATHLYWRRRRPVAGVEHLYANAVLVSADGALLAVRMNAHTANAGRVYFASGVLEPSDFRDRRAALEANMYREVAEETGLDLSEARAEPCWFVLSLDSGTVVFRRYLFDDRAEKLVSKVHDFLSREQDPEIAEPVIIRGQGRCADATPAMQILIDWHFGAITEDAAIAVHDSAHS